MANDVSNFNKQKLTRMVQALLEERLLAMSLANMTLKADMPDGNTINFPRPVYNNVGSYTKYTDVTDKPTYCRSKAPSIDHLKPRSLGGSDYPNNLKGDCP